MAKLTSEERDKLPDSDFVFPETKSYPIHDENHARDALARSAGKPEHAAVVKKVKERFPDMKINDEKVAADAMVASIPGQAGMMPMSNGHKLHVHIPTGGMSHEDARHVPKGSTLTVKDGSGDKEGTRKFKVGEHEPHEMGVKPTLKQTSGDKLVNEDAGHEPHLGHVVAHMEHQKSMGYCPPDCDCDSGTAMSAGTPAFILDLDGGTMADVSPGIWPTKNDAGKPIHYRKMLAANVGDWKHRGNGSDLPIPQKRAEAWVNNTNALCAAGVEPFIPLIHDFQYDFKNPIPADKNYGYVKRMELEGDNVWAVVALHGDDALDIAAKNGRSVGITKDAMDAKGKVYAGESLHHLALRPNPALPHLGGMVKVAASADGAATEIPIYAWPSANKTPADSRKGSKMTPAIAAQARTALALDATVTDDNLDDAVAQKAIELAKKTKEQETRIIALSADDVGSLTPSNLAAHQFNAEALWDLAKKAGQPAGTIKALQDLFRASGKPNRVALAASADNGHPLEFNIARILASAAMPLGVQIPTGRDVTFPIKLDGQVDKLTAEQMKTLADKAGYAVKPA